MSDYVLKIIDDKEKLSERCQEINAIVDGQIVTKVVNELKDTLLANDNVTALCAPQIGYNYRIFAIKFQDGDMRAFVNPMITKSEGIHLSRESNPSLPGKEYIVPRNNKIIACFQTPVGKVDQNIFEGVVAEVFQQQVNMLDGILLDEMGLELIPEFDKATEEEKQEVINWWLDELKSRNEKLNEEIQKDPEALEIKKAIEYMKSVALGETETIKVEEPKEEEAGEA